MRWSERPNVHSLLSEKWLTAFVLVVFLMISPTGGWPMTPVDRNISGASSGRPSATQMYDPIAGCSGLNETRVTQPCETGVAAGADTEQSSASAQLIRSGGASSKTSAVAQGGAFSQNLEWSLVDAWSWDALPTAFSSAMAYDSALGEIILFGGGGQPTGTSNTTWAYREGQWIELTPASPEPPARYGAGLAYDAADGYLVLFGGISAGGKALNDTWIFRNNIWSQIDVAGASPSPRAFFGMTYDSAGGFILLFGGILQNGLSDSNETWEFNAGLWHLISPPLSPAPRDQLCLAFDPEDGGDILFGGTYDLADTWLFRDGQWTEFNPSNPHPEGRFAATMAYDYADGVMILYGGHNLSTGIGYADSWEFDGQNWTQFNPSSEPDPDVNQAMTYDFSDGYILFMGGYPQTTTWALKGSETTGFRHLATGNVSPSPRSGAGLAYDPHDGYSLMFGGFGPNPLGDTWIFVNGDWSKLSPKGEIPSPRGDAMMAYDPGESSVILFGGSNGTQLLDDTWEFVSGDWTNITTNGPTPPPRDQAAFTYDAADGYLLLFGGQGEHGPLNDTWAFKDGVWTQLFPGGMSPAPMSEPGAAFDSSDGYVVLAGGLTESGASTSTWLFQNGNWSLLPQQGCTTDFGAATMAYDDRNGVVVEYGNSTDGGRTVSLFEDGYWICPSISVPSPRTGTAMTYDESAGGLILFGGASAPGPGYLNDTWALGTVFGVVITSQPSASDIGERTRFAIVPFGGFPNFQATVTSGPPGCLGNFTGLIWTCQPIAVGNFSTNFTVLDDQSLNASASLPVYRVYPDPAASTPSASRSSADVGQGVSFQFNASAGSGQYVNFSWNGLYGSVCTGTWTLRITCQFDSSGTRSISATVTDSNGMTSVASPILNFSVFADPSANTPSANRTSADSGQAATFTVSPTGGTGTLKVMWHIAPFTACVGEFLDALTCTFHSVGTYMVSVSINDSNGFNFSGPSTEFEVYSPPVANAPVLSSAIIPEGDMIVLRATGSGGAPLERLTWINLPLPCNATTYPTVTCRPDAVGEYSIRYRVEDGNDEIATSPASVLSVVPPLRPVGSSPPRLIDPIPAAPPTRPRTGEGGGLPSTDWFPGLLAASAGAGTAAFLFLRRKRGSTRP